MKKLLTVGLVSLGFVSTSVLGSEVRIYSTSKHNIRITVIQHDSDSQEGKVVYQSWNKPKRVGQGSPDFVMNGTYHEGPMSHEYTTEYTFKKGNLRFEISDLGVNHGLVKHPRNVWGEMDIYVNGKKKDHYWVYWENDPLKK